MHFPFLFKLIRYYVYRHPLHYSFENNLLIAAVLFGKRKVILYLELEKHVIFYEIFNKITA